MKCLVLAAGKGERLANRGDSKPLISFLGLTLIERVILTASRSGISEFYVVTGYNSEKVEHFLHTLGRERRIRIVPIKNDEWREGNGISVLKAKELLNENFILLMSDHIFDESILSNLKNQTLNDGEVMLAVDYNIETNTLVDIDDVTKVLVDEGLKIVDIGKTINSYNAYDTGIFLCSPSIFDAIEESIAGGDSSLSGGMKALIEKGKARAFDIEGKFWIDIDDENALRKVKRELLRSTLGKISDGPVSRYLNRPVSVRMTRWLLKANITPNQISTFSFILSVTGAIFFFLEGYINLVVGAILAQLASIIDGCDGEIARLKFKASDFGGWYDAVLDRYADAFLLFGLTYHVYSSDRSFIVLLIGFLAIIGSFMNSYTADKYDGLMKRKLTAMGSYFRIGRDVRIFIIFVGALLNQALLTLTLIALIMNAENVRRVIAVRKNG